MSNFYFSLFFLYTEAPKAPSNLRVKKINSDKVTLEWKSPKDDGGSKVTGYKLRMREDGSDVWTDVAVLKPFDNEYTFKDLTTGKGYFFSVVPENKMGLGEAAETQEAAVPFKKPGLYNKCLFKKNTLEMGFVAIPHDNP